MEENNQFQDILLDKDVTEEKTSKARKILIAVAALVILFLIVLIVVKSMHSGKSEPSGEAMNTLVLPEEPSVNPQPKAGNDIFEQVPIVAANDAKSDFENIVNDYKNSRAENNDTGAILPKSDVESELMPKTVAPKPEAKSESKITAKTEPKKEQKTTAKKQAEAKKVVSKDDGVSKKPAANSNLNSKKGSNAGKAGAGTYIQVASVSKFDPNNALIKKVVNAGYNYRTYETTVNGKPTVKILVGPYSGEALNENIAKIRRDIDAKAFKFIIK